MFRPEGLMQMRHSWPEHASTQPQPKPLLATTSTLRVKPQLPVPQLDGLRSKCGFVRLEAASRRHHFTRRAMHIHTAHSLLQVKHLMEDGDPDGYPSMLNCPYVGGARLSLTYFSEGDLGTQLPLEVEIQQPLLPFTSAQALLVKQNEPATINELPSQFVLKLQDRRFRRTFASNSAYDPSLENYMRKGLYKIEHENARPNPFSELGGTDEYPPSGEIPWIDHVEDWLSGRFMFSSEVEAYRRLRAFQAKSIPRMFGTVRLQLRSSSNIKDPPGYVHPALDTVDGLVLEYIDGFNLDHYKVGVNITEENADRVAHATFAALRDIRDVRVCHNDLRLANIIIRHGDYDNPVIIDWARAIIKQPDEDEKEWASSLPYALVHRMRVLFANEGFHMPSPYLCNCKDDPNRGYQFLNWTAELLRPDWRDRLFEPIENAPEESIEKVDSEGIVHHWMPARWRPRPGIYYAPDRDYDRI